MVLLALISIVVGKLGWPIAATVSLRGAFMAAIEFPSSLPTNGALHHAKLAMCTLPIPHIVVDVEHSHHVCNQMLNV